MFEKRFSRRGEILVENIIFIILNLIFLTILMVFLFSKMGSVAVLEEMYAKQIALTLDSAEPGMEIHFNMENAFDKKEKEWDVLQMVNIQENVVTVKLQEKGGYAYSFFNNIEVGMYPDKDENNEYNGFYVITIN
ncbi:hypothetical protein KAR52_02760 [Candidatus Pacearchaeota archaeon]|nr:hypothetical protein [Candidatus Pacearchaeota archaeon]